MNKKTTTLVAAAALAIGLTAAGSKVLYAQSANGTGPMSNLVKAIAQKFSLNETDVQQVFTEHRGQMQAQKEEIFKARLSELVASGKLTQEQADKIIARHSEFQAQMDSTMASLAGKTPEERRAAIQAKMSAQQAWAAENNIPMQYLNFGFGGKDKGPHGFWNQGQD